MILIMTLGLRVLGSSRGWGRRYAYHCHRFIVRLYPHERTGHISSLSQPDRGVWFNLRWPYWSAIIPVSFPSGTVRLTHTSKEGFLYKALVGDGKQGILPWNFCAYVDARVFLIQVFLCLLAIASVSLLLHLPKRRSEIPWRKQLPRIDILGALLLILTVFGLLFGLDRGSNVSWRSPLTIASICGAVPLSIAFIVVETRYAVEPFTPGHVIFDKALVACYIQNFFGYAAFTALIFYLPLFFQAILQMAPAQAGAGLIPAAVSVVVGTLVGGVTIRKTGRFYWLAVIAATLATIGSIPIAVAPSLDDRGALASIYTASVVGGVPQGVTITASLIAISRFSTSNNLHIPMSLQFPQSLQCLSGRSSRSHRVRFSLPIPRCSRRYLLGRHAHSKRFADEASGFARTSTGRSDSGGHRAEPGIHQGSASFASYYCHRLLQCRYSSRVCNVRGITSLLRIECHLVARKEAFGVGSMF